MKNVLHKYPSSLQGVSLSEGRAVGILKKISPFQLLPSEEMLEEGKIDTKQERKKLLEAFLEAKEELLILEKKMHLERAETGALLIFSEIELLQDNDLKEKALKRISSKKESASIALKAILGLYKEKFLSLKDPFFQEKFKDLEDVGNRVLLHLQEEKASEAPHPLQEVILFAEELSISLIAEADPQEVKGFISLKGNYTSHAAILARSRGFPYLLIQELPSEITEGTLIALDCLSQSLFISPNKEFLTDLFPFAEQGEKNAPLLTSSCLIETKDNVKIHLSLNVDTLNEISLRQKECKQSLQEFPIGLFRSEYLLFQKNSFPSEEEQFLSYKQIAERKTSSYSIVRTFDIGGDKNFASTSPFLSLQDLKPFLSLRTLKFLLKEKTIFKTQIRAILRANAFGSLAILLPMISNFTEIAEAKQLVEEVKEDLLKENIPFNPDLPLGCMIELPSACMVANLIAKECDFLSIGTNDLIQYSFGIDRTLSKFNSNNAHLEPAIFHLIHEILQRAQKEKSLTITLCGEMANDLVVLPLLLGLGITHLSIPPYKIGQVQEKIASLSIKSCKNLLQKALLLKTSEEVLALLQTHL